MIEKIEHVLPSCIDSLKSEKSEESIRATCSCLFPSDFPGFQGHFPGQPVLPAIVQLATVRYVAELVTGHRLEITSYAKSKFRAMIVPEEEVVIHLSLQYSGEPGEGKFEIRNDEKGKITTGRCSFHTMRTTPSIRS